MKNSFNNIKINPIFFRNMFGHNNFIINIVKSVKKVFQFRINTPVLNNSAISFLSTVLQLKSCETSNHSQRLCQLSFLIGEQLELEELELKQLRLLCLLHDIGKITVPKHILEKPDKLTSEEWLIMQNHVQYGYQICRFNPELTSVAELILCHHERYDGQGYPRNLKGEAIPLLSRILSLADAYDAMTNDRSYKKALSNEEAKKEIIHRKGTQFDPELADIFIRVLDQSGQ